MSGCERGQDGAGRHGMGREGACPHGTGRDGTEGRELVRSGVEHVWVGTVVLLDATPSAASWRSIRHGAIAWSRDEVEAIGDALHEHLPPIMRELITSGHIAGGAIIDLPEPYAPKSSDVSRHYM